MNFIALLLCKFSFLLADLQPGEERWMVLPLLPFSEEEVSGDGKGWLRENGLTLDHSELHREPKRFDSWEELKQWVHSEVASRLGCSEDETFAEEYLGWLQRQNHLIERERQWYCIYKYFYVHVVRKAS